MDTVLKQARDVLAWLHDMAEGGKAVDHLYDSDCPDQLDRSRRDPACPACKAMDKAAAAMAAIDAQAATVGAPKSALDHMHARCAADVQRAFGDYAAAPPAVQAPQVTPHNVGRWCMGEDECRAAGYHFRSYERGVSDAADAFGRNTARAANAAPVALAADADEAILRTGPDLLALAQQWADNKIHTYQFSMQAERIVRGAVLAAAGAAAQGGEHV